MRRDTTAALSTGRTLQLAACCILACLCWACHHAGQERHTDSQRIFAPRDITAPYDGIDISSHQGMIDWARVTQDKNIRFVFIKAPGHLPMSCHATH